MAGCDDLRGDGLARVQEALWNLGEDFNHSGKRRSYSSPPPPYMSNSSGTTTRSASPVPHSEQQRLFQERQVEIGLEYEASLPHEQFSYQCSAENARLFQADLDKTFILPVGSDLDEMAYDYVKNCWVEQGIWNDKWNKFANGRWKHEEPLEFISNSEKDSEAESSSDHFTFDISLKQPERQGKLRWPESDVDKRQFTDE